MHCAYSHVGKSPPTNANPVRVTVFVTCAGLDLRGFKQFVRDDENQALALALGGGPLRKLLTE